MQVNIKLGSIWGIPIGINYSWFLIFALVTFSLASGQLPMQIADLSLGGYWIIALFISILFFGSVLAHELGHALLALRNDVPVKSISLFLLGGVAQITREPRTPGSEFRIAIAGPLVSLALGLFFGLIYLLSQNVAVIAVPALWLARINIILALFNMIPGFPLDGGRVLRAVVWQITGQEFRSTRVASVAGQVVAYSFIGFGILSLFVGNPVNGLWLAFIGFFLRNAASGSYQYANMQEALQGVSAADIMSRHLTKIPGYTPLSSLTGPQSLGQGTRAFFVSDENEIRGMLTLTDVAGIPENHRPLTAADQVMVPEYLLTSVDPDTELFNALTSMEENKIKQVPVIENGKVLGLLSRDQILQYLRNKTELDFLTRRFTPSSA